MNEKYFNTSVKDTVCKLNTGPLEDFLKLKDECYRKAVFEINLFKPSITKSWSRHQQQLFAKVFYHLRGHFHEFLWVLGNFAPNEQVKNIILKNISEEFGEKRQSHEQLYCNFAEKFDVNIIQEIILEENYLDFAKDFNKGHIQWLLNHCWNEKQSAFSAYERLDNIDYLFLVELVRSFGLTDESMVFFNVHTKVGHYDTTQPLLEKIWDEDAQSVINGFEFIYNHQLNMWRELSDLVNNC